MSSIFRDRMGNSLSWSVASKKIFNRIINYWLDFELMILRFVGNIPLHTVRNFFYGLAGVKIEKGARIHMWANFYNPRNVTIGKGSIIGDHVFLDGRAKLTIGREVDIASEVQIYNAEHDINSMDFRPSIDEVVIGDYVFIGPRVIILPGVHIGKGAVVAAGAVVTKSVAEFAVVGGVPAKVIGERKNKDPQYKLGRARLFQ